MTYLQGMGATNTEAIRMARRSCGWTQAQLAERIGVSVDTIRRAELGQRDLLVTTLLRIARATGVTLESLVKDEART